MTLTVGLTASEQARANLTEKLKEVAAKKKAEAEEQQACEHVFKKYKQTIKATNPNFTGTAYLIVNVCTVCHIKVNVGYKIEK